MERKGKVNRWLAAAALACILQVIGLIRDANRLPEDWRGTLWIKNRLNSTCPSWEQCIY